MNPPLYVSGLQYPDMKTARAGVRLQQFRDAVALFRTEAPYTVTKEDDVEHRRQRVRITLDCSRHTIPILIGEFAYNLKSGLDQLTWQLALLSDHQPTRDIAFPIQTDRSRKSQERFMLATWDLPGEAIEIIKTLQPYTRGDQYKTHPLWQLRKLCQLDKHATLEVLHADIAITLSGLAGALIRRELFDGVELSIPLELKDQVSIEPQPPDLLFGKPAEALGPEFAVSEADITKIYEFVRDDVLPRFVRFFAWRSR